MDKYEFVDEVRLTRREVFSNDLTLSRRPLRRIRALRDFGSVKTGDLGGFIENETNLSHDGDCWVFPSGSVFGGAEISGNAQIFGEVSGKARVFGNSVVKEFAEVIGYAVVSDGVVETLRF